MPIFGHFEGDIVEMNMYTKYKAIAGDVIVIAV